MERIETINFKYEFNNEFIGCLRLKKYTFAQNKKQIIIDKIIDGIKAANKIELINNKEPLINDIDDEIKWYRVYGGKVDVFNSEEFASNILKIYLEKEERIYQFSSGVYYEFETIRIRERHFDEIYLVTNNKEHLNYNKSYKWIISAELAMSIDVERDYLISDNIKTTSLVGIVNGMVYISNNIDDINFSKVSDDYFEVLGVYVKDNYKYDYIFDGNKLIKLKQVVDYHLNITCKSIQEFIELKKHIDKHENFKNIDDALCINYEGTVVPPYVPKQFEKTSDKGLSYLSNRKFGDFEINIDYSKLSRSEVVSFLGELYVKYLMLNKMCNERNKSTYFTEITLRLNKLKDSSFSIPGINYIQNVKMIYLDKLEKFIFEEYKKYIIWLEANINVPSVGCIYKYDNNEVLCIKYYEEIDEGIIEARNRKLDLKVEVV